MEDLRDKEMRVALFQMYIEWENKTKNFEHLENQLEKLQSEEIDLLLLPEMSFTGFSMNTDKTKEADEHTVNQMKKYAIKIYTKCRTEFI